MIRTSIWFLIAFSGFVCAAGEPVLANDNEADSSKPAAYQLLEKSVQYRRQTFPRGEVVILEHITRVPDRGDEFLHTAVFDGDNYHVHQLTRKEGSTDWNDGSHFILNDIKFIEVFRHPAISSPSVKVTFRDDENPNSQQRFAFDPRALGMCMGGASDMGRSGVDGILKWFENSSSEPVETKYNGNSVLMIEQSNGEIQRKVWVDPNRGYSIVAVSATAANYNTAMDVTLQKTKEGEWFPKQVVIKTRHAGKMIRLRQLTVQRAEFDKKIAPNEFELTGLVP